MSLIGNTTLTTGLAAAPDVATLGRLSALMGRYAQDMGGGYGPNGRGVIGYDRGDPANSFAGPVRRVASPTKSIAQITADANAVYKPPANFQSAALMNPDLDPYARLLIARTNGGS